MQSSMKGFVFGLGISVFFLFAFFAGAIADRVFVIKPLDAFTNTRRDGGLFNLGSNQSSDQATVLTTDERSLVQVTEEASASVVTIAIKQQRQQSQILNFGPFGLNLRPSAPENAEPQQQDIGSGFIASADGLIVTNKHVVDSPGEYLVIDREDKEHKVTNIYRDPVNDLAILKVEGLQGKALELGNSEQLKVGQQVIAIGTALGEFRHTVTTGVVSGLGRGIEASSSPFGGYVESLENVIQTDAAINPGNSGGPLLDSSGKVIGVSVAVSAAGQNIGFAIPINVVKESLDNFNNTGKFDRPFLGVRYVQIPERTAIMNELPQGAYIVEVVPGSSASDAGLKPEDIITEFDGQKMKDKTIPELLKQKKVGDKLKIKYWRDGAEQEAEVTLKVQQE